MKLTKMIGVTTLAASIAASIATPVMAEDAQKIRLVMPHPNLAVGEEVFLYAVPKALGFFEEEGLDVSVSTVSGSVAAGQVLISGTADIAPMLAEAALSIREQGGDPKAFYSLKRNNGFTVGVMPDSDIKSVADVSGKTVGFSSAGSGPDKLLREQLRQLGEAPEYNGISLGTGPAVITAMQSGRIDALMMWDAIYAIFENQGMTLDHYELPIQDEIAGYTLATTDSYMAENPEQVEGFCRASAKALHFTLTDPAKAIEIFYKEFPSLMPAGQSYEDAVADGVNILDAWLDRAQKGVPYGEKTGYEDPTRWENSQTLYTQFGQLKGNIDVTDAYTNDYFDACNDFDRDAVAELAKNYVVKR